MLFESQNESRDCFRRILRKMADNFLNLTEEIHLQNQENKKISNIINSKKAMPRHRIIKLLKTKDKIYKYRPI